MKLIDLVRKNRSFRRFDQSVLIAEDTLRELIELARITPSAMNAQPLCYMISCEPAMNKRVFGTPAWAGFLKDWDGPEPGEQPTGYVVVLVDTAINPNADQDVGIACQTMLLGAAERGLGVPVEHVILEEADSDASVKYYREPDGTHHVPKRRLADLILKSFK